MKNPDPNIIHYHNILQSTKDLTAIIESVPFSLLAVHFGQPHTSRDLLSGTTATDRQMNAILFIRSCFKYALDAQSLCDGDKTKKYRRDKTIRAVLCHTAKAERKLALSVGIGMEELVSANIVPPEVAKDVMTAVTDYQIPAPVEPRRAPFEINFPKLIAKLISQLIWALERPGFEYLDLVPILKVADERLKSHKGTKPSTPLLEPLSGDVLDYCAFI